MTQPPPGFEWDPKQQEKCERESGLSFFDAVHVFQDEERDYLRIGPRDFGGEWQYIAIGCIEGGTIVAVYYTMRQGLRRLIWVRAASRKERAAFLEHNE